MSPIHFYSALDIVKGINNKQFTAEAVMVAHLNQIEKVNPLINALTQRFSPEHCLEQARQVDQQVANNIPLKKLSGVPVAIKDALNVKGLVCSAGSPGLYKQGIADSDATIVTRLKAQGAIIIGITNVPELCRGGDSDNLIYGRTNNPYDLQRTAGGSSGGAAALVAAGGVPFAIGSDGGGSIVQPSHCNGIAGLKPTHGLVPPTGSIGGELWGMYGALITCGPMARSIKDLMLGISVIAGVDGKNPYTFPIELKPALPLKQLRIAYFTDNGVIPVAKEIQHTVKQGALSLKDAVHSVVEAMPPIIAKAYDLHWDLFLGGDKGIGFKQMLQNSGAEKISWELQEFVRQAQLCELSAAQLRDRFIEIDRFRFEMLAFMENFDVIISPVFPKVAKPHGIGLKEISDFSYAMAHNLTGWPTVVVRCGTASDGLPIGVQVAARAWEDHTALMVAERLEQLHGGWIAPNI